MRGLNVFVLSSLLLAAMGWPRSARAGGVTWSDRGVRPMSRGGAYVAGADDLGATWYNPAGIVHAKTSIMADAAVIFFSSEYTRRTVVSDTGGATYQYQFPTVSGKSAFLPIPTVAGSYAFGREKNWVVAAGVLGPYALIPLYPPDGAQRYSLIDQRESKLAITGLWLAHTPVPWLHLGAGLIMLNGFYNAAIAFNANPRDRLLGSPEDRTYDAVGQLDAGFIMAPAVNAGVQIVPDEHVRFGASVQTPFTINTGGTIDLRLPDAAPFDRASVQGEKANLRFPLPWALRFGVEGRPIKPLRIELAYVFDGYSRTESIDVTPENVQLLNVTGFPSPYRISPIKIPLNMNDGHSIRFGGEYTIKNVANRFDLDLRSGIMFDPAAVPKEYLTVLTFDTGKVHLGLGAGVHVAKHWRADVMYMHSFGFEQTVDPREARVSGINPVRGNPTATETVNGGTYSASANTVGIGGQYTF